MTRTPIGTTALATAAVVMVLHGMEQLPPVILHAAAQQLVSEVWVEPDHTHQDALSQRDPARADVAQETRIVWAHFKAEIDWT
jgi:hypothetical protein